MRKLIVNSKPAKPATVAKPAKPAKAAKPAKLDNKPAADTAVADKPRQHDIGKLTYAGPSPTVRGHGRKLTPITPGKTFGPATERDNSFLRDLRAKYAGAVFYRLDCDAGCVNRQLHYGNMRIVDGDPASRTLRLQITPRGIGLKL